MRILDFLEKISKVDEKTKSVLYNKLIIDSNIFRKYMELNSNHIPKIAEFNDYIPDDAPAGYNLSSLEMQYKKFHMAVYTDVSDKIRNKMLREVFEAVNPLEVDFLKKIMNRTLVI
jgi:hypothetical protein